MTPTCGGSKGGANSHLRDGFVLLEVIHELVYCLQQVCALLVLVTPPRHLLQVCTALQAEGERLARTGQNRGTRTGQGRTVNMGEALCGRRVGAPLNSNFHSVTHKKARHTIVVKLPFPEVIPCCLQHPFTLLTTAGMGRHSQTKPAACHARHHPCTSSLILTCHGCGQHSQAPESSDGVGEVLLGIVHLLDVPAHGDTPWRQPQL